MDTAPGRIADPVLVWLDRKGATHAHDAHDLYERALAAASALYSREWKAAQGAPTYSEACRLSLAAEKRRIAAWQTAAQMLRETRADQ